MECSSQHKQHVFSFKKAYPLHYYILSQSLLGMLFTFMEDFVVLSMTCIWTFNDSVTVLLPVL